MGIVLPDFNGNFVEYGYGDWDWYVLMCDKWYHIFDTVLWPTQGCLGRRTIPSAGAEPRLSHVSLEPIAVNGEKARELFCRLEALFQEKQSTLKENRVYGLSFVEHDDGFWFLNNCVDAVADWMEELGCEVSWRLVRFDIEVEKD